MSLLLKVLLNRWVCGAVTIPALLVMAYFERYWDTIPLAFMIAFATTAFLVLVTGRLVTSIYAALFFLTFIALASYLKIKFMTIAVNVVDLYYFVGNKETVYFLLENYQLYIAAAMAVLGLAVLALIVLGRAEAPLRRARLVSGVAFPVLVGAAFLAQPKEFNGLSDLMGNRYVTAPFLSLRYLAHLGDEIPVLEHLKTAKASHQQVGPNGLVCPAKGHQPDLIAIQAESVSIPSASFGDKTPPVLKAAFSGPQSNIRPLQVEVFAGGTWVTTAGFLTGLPISELGWLKPYANFILEDQVSWSLPKYLSECGYHTVYFMPMSYGFLNEGRFVESLGFETVVDAAGMNAGSLHEPDQFYYAKALEYIRQHRKEDGRPIFMTLLTMSAHSPYNYRLAPNEKLEGEPFSKDPVLNEYFRRLKLTRSQLDDFVGELESGEGSRPGYLLEFGDHQAFLALPHLKKKHGERVLSDPASVAYQTFYQVVPFGAELASSYPEYERLDVQYLGATFLEMAGLPLDPMHRDVAAMRDLCQGQFSDCSVAGRVEAHFECRKTLSEADCAPEEQLRLAKREIGSIKRVQRGQ